MAVQDTVSRFAVMLGEALDLAYYTRGKALSLVYPSLLDVEKVEGANRYTYDVAAFGLHVQNKELTPVTYDNYEQGTKQEDLWEKYGLAWRVSDELLEDLATGSRVKEGVRILKDVNEKFRDSANQTMEAIAVQPFISGTSTTKTSLWRGAIRDGKALFATNHLTKKNPSKLNSNLMTGASPSSIQLMLAETMFANMLSDEGYYVTRPTSFTIFCGTYWEWRFREILKTDGQLDSNNNNADPLDKKRYKLVVNPHFGPDFKGWGVLAEGHKIKFFERQKPRFKEEPDFEVSGKKYKSTFRCSTGVDDYRLAIFNPGP